MRSRGKKNDLGKDRYRGTKIIIRKKTYCRTARKENKFRRHRVALECTRAGKEDKQQQVSFVTQGTP